METGGPEFRIMEHLFFPLYTKPKQRKARAHDSDNMLKLSRKFKSTPEVLRTEHHLFGPCFVTGSSYFWSSLSFFIIILIFKPDSIFGE